MSSSSSSSFTSRDSSRRVVDIPAICSVTPQQGIFDYEGPDVRCDCGKKCPQWVSWTEKHPGMRFFSCPVRSQKILKRQNENGGIEVEIGCNFFRFADPLIAGRAKDVILGMGKRQKELFYENRSLLREKEAICTKIEALEKEKNGHLNEIEELKEENMHLLVEVYELKKKGEAVELELRKRWKKLNMVLAICVMVAVLIIMKM